MQTEFIAEIHFNGAEILNEKFRELEKNEKLRVVVLLVELEKNENFEAQSELPEIIKNFPVPVICAIKSDLLESILPIIENSHLCIAAESENAFDALEKGLINKIAARQEIETEAFELAEKISENAPVAVRSFIKAVNRGLEMNLKDGLNLESELFQQIFATEDMREGISAFLEKRRPLFRGT